MYSPDGYRAITSGHAIVRRGDRGVLSVGGTDRLEWLQGLLTNDVVNLQPGESRYAAYLTPQGRMITDMRVIALADRALLEVPGTLAAALRARLDALIFAEDAQVTDESASIAVIDAYGTGAVVPTSIVPIALVRDPIFGVPAVTFFTAASDAVVVVDALVAAGAIETTLETLDVVRVESGTPQFLIDMDEHTIPLEAGIEDRAISFTKGCYVGQEVIVRVTQRGQGRVAKRLVGLSFEKNSSPKSGDSIRSGDRAIGRVTSVVWSPTLRYPIALGYVHRDFVEPGTRVDVDNGTTTCIASVTPLPFVAAFSAH
jgi:tRNA-modifying protein YgfZ